MTSRDAEPPRGVETEVLACLAIIDFTADSSIVAGSELVEYWGGNRNTKAECRLLDWTDNGTELSRKARTCNFQVVGDEHLRIPVTVQTLEILAVAPVVDIADAYRKAPVEAVVDIS